jgi:hypothetical protein
MNLRILSETDKVISATERGKWQRKKTNAYYKAIIFVLFIIF